MKRGGEIRRTSKRPRSRNTGPTAEVVALVWQRDQGSCAFCGAAVLGVRGLDYSLHHRMARKGGGSRRLFVNLPGNLVLLHGTGSVGCHFRVESDGLWSRDNGFKVREGRWLPTEVAIDHAHHGRVYLLDDGSVSYGPPLREDVG